MHQYILKQVDLLQKRGELDNRGHIKNIKAAQTEANTKKFNLDWIPIALKTKKIRFIKTIITQKAF